MRTAVVHRSQHFSSLTKEAQKAARAIRQLDKARSEANQNSKQDIVDVQGFDRQEQAVLENHRSVAKLPC